MMAQGKPASQPCRDLEEDLVLYYYGELVENDRHNCEAHLKDCEHCRAILAEMTKLLPMTAAYDQPPPAFWNDYSRELRQKLELAAERQSWRRSIAGLFAHIPMPALATAAVVALALTLTFGKGWWRGKDAPPEDELLMEVLPVAENLEFFRTMEVLDAMDLLEFMSSQGNGKA